MIVCTPYIRKQVGPEPRLVTLSQSVAQRRGLYGGLVSGFCVSTPGERRRRASVIVSLQIQEWGLVRLEGFEPPTLCSEDIPR